MTFVVDQPPAGAFDAFCDRIRRHPWKLSQRHCEVLFWACAGEVTNAGLARRLGCSLATIRSHWWVLTRRLDRTTRCPRERLIRWAYPHYLVAWRQAVRRATTGALLDPRGSAHYTAYRDRFPVYWTHARLVGAGDD